MRRSDERVLATEHDRAVGVSIDDATSHLHDGTTLTMRRGYRDALVERFGE